MSIHKIERALYSNSDAKLFTASERFRRGCLRGTYLCVGFGGCFSVELLRCSGVLTGGGVGGSNRPPLPPPKFRRPSKIVPNSTRFWKLLKIAEFRTPTPQDVRGKKGSKILKLPPVRNCFTLAMTNKLVVIINSRKVPKINKNFTIWNEISCTKLQLLPEPLTRGYRLPVL